MLFTVGAVSGQQSAVSGQQTLPAAAITEVSAAKLDTVTPLSATKKATTVTPITTTKTATDLVAAANQTKTSQMTVAKSLEAEIDTATTKLNELRQLVADGLVARMELENAEHLLLGLRANLETSRKNIADSENLIADLRKAEELAQAKPLLPVSKNGSTRSFLKPVILRYGGQGGWSLGSLAAVQTFFAGKFGQTLPISALGQSATHNRLGYNHRNAVDVALHPDSIQGQALIGYLQSQGIPFLAFRAAVAGVATGPHIHIGLPSSRT